MSLDIIALIIAFLLGFAVAFLNYLISKKVIVNCPEKYATANVLRQLLQIVFLVVVYFAGCKLPINIFYPLIGAVLGLTLPMFYFTKKLLELNSTTKIKEKGENTDG